MSTLLSVNVGRPRDVAWRGQTVYTGIWKAPVNDPVLVRRLNLDGDGQGDLNGHGGEQRAVMVYQVESYQHWSEYLGRSDLNYGIFGENFTVDGLPDNEVCIGDQYRIGQAEFEVTQPRTTCYRVGVRLNEPRMASLLVAHHRPGFYFRVLREGLVQAGDEIVKLSAGPEQVTVSSTDALLYLPGSDIDTMRRLLKVPALSPGWQGSFRQLVDQNDDDHHAGQRPISTVPAWAGFAQAAWQLASVSHAGKTTAVSPALHATLTFDSRGDTAIFDDTLNTTGGKITLTDSGYVMSGSGTTLEGHVGSDPTAELIIRAMAAASGKALASDKDAVSVRALIIRNQLVLEAQGYGLTFNHF